jgi:hypothetical protein
MLALILRRTAARRNSRSAGAVHAWLSTLAIATLFALLAGIAAPAARATTNVVTSLSDSGPGSLRQAIADAAPGSTITFGVSGTLTLTSAELAISKDLTLSGPGAASLSISGGRRPAVCA